MVSGVQKGERRYPAFAHRLALSEAAVEIRTAGDPKAMGMGQLQAALDIAGAVLGMVGFDSPKPGLDQGGQRGEVIILAGVGQHGLAARPDDAAHGSGRIGGGEGQGSDRRLPLGPPLEQPLIKGAIETVAAAGVHQRLHDVLLAQVAAGAGVAAHRLQ